MRYATLIIVCFLVFMLNGCKEQPLQIFVDNPLDETLHLNVGEAHYEIAPDSFVVVEMEPGAKELYARINSDYIILDTTQEFYHDGLLNLCGYNYIVWKYPYSETGKSEAAKDYEVIEINGRGYYGIFDTYDSTRLFIVKDWDFDLHESFPEQVKVKNETEVLRAKIYREGDFTFHYNLFYKSF